MTGSCEEGMKWELIGGQTLFAILESVDEPIYVADPASYELLYLNPAAVRVWGDRRGELCHRVLQKREEPCPFCTNPIIFGRESNRPHIWIFRNEVNNRWYKCTDRVIRWTDGRPVRFEMAIDITDRILAEQALRDGEERYRVLVESSLDAIYLKTMDGEIIDCNRAACEMLGYTKSELLRMTTSDLLPEESREVLPRKEKELRTGGRSYFTGGNLRRDGTVVPVESWARVIGTSDGERVVVYVRDISERVNSQRELVESEKRFRSFMDQIPAAVFLKDASGRYVYVNSYMRNMFGSNESWIGRHTSECFALNEAELLLKNDDEAMKEDYSINVQKVVDAERLERIFQIHKFRISKEAGERDLLGGIALDITDRVNAENARKSLEEQIQHTQKLESLGVLAGGIAHDFNNILMAILGYADLALLDTKPASQSRSYIEEIEKAARNAADLTKQMLAYSGRGRFQVTRLDINSIIREMTHLLEISVSKNAVIRYDLEEDIPAVEADPSQIRQIVMNLVTNASDALEETSGTITLRTSAMECDREYIRKTFLGESLEEGSYIYMEVSDNGSGMDEETMQRLFDPFFTTKFSGRGLGLSAVLGIVRGHGGSIKVYSEKGRGSCFKVLLPAVEGEAEPLRLEEVCDIEDVSGGTVLLVDDEPAVREVGRSMLEKKGYEVLTANDGREALEIFGRRSAEIDCVLLDLTMPHMNGEETFRQMRMIREDIPVIISSGYNRDEVTQRFVGKGLTDFIQKPYRLSELQSKLREVLRE